MELSYPKENIKVLLLENIHEKAKLAFEEKGYQVQTFDRSLNEEELCEQVKDIHILGIRSKTKISQKVISSANSLLGIGTFCIGTDQVDKSFALENGLPVFNAPFSNTRSVVELAIGEMILLSRSVVEKSNQLHKGMWNKSSKDCNEIRGKKLGIIGYGNIGSQLSVLAENLGMEVYYYDISEKLPMGNAKKSYSISSLVKKCDIITVHIDGRESNKHIIDEDVFNEMKDGAIFLNLSRGKVVDLKALSENLKSGKLFGAAVDVYPEEPRKNGEDFVNELQTIPNVILTPHIGGSTEEAQERIAEFVPSRLIEFINTGATEGSVNFPNIQMPAVENAHRLIHIHKNVPGILSKINTILAEHNINIISQFQKGDNSVAYVITAINKDYDKDVVEALKNIEETIKIRVLY